MTQPTNLGKGLFQQQPTSTPSVGGMGGMFGQTQPGQAGKNKNENLGVFGATATNQGMQTPGMGFSSSVFPQTSTPGLMSVTATTQPGLFGGTGNIGGGPGIFGGGPTNQPTGIPQNQTGINIFNQQPQAGIQQIQNLGTGLTPGMQFGLGQQQNPPSGSGLFGATTSSNIFGGGATTTSTGGILGQSVMGGTSTLQQPSNTMGMMGKPGVFGNTMGQTQPQGFQAGNLGMGGSISTGIQQPPMKGSHVYKYQPTRTQETSIANGSQKTDITFMSTITAMPEYASKSIEELRYEDFSNKKQGIIPQTMQQPMGNLIQPSQQSNMGMFGTQSSLLGPQKNNPFQSNTLQNQPIQQPSIGGSLFSQNKDNKTSFMQNQPLTQQPQQQSLGMGFFQQPASNTMGFTQQPQQQTPNLLGNLQQAGSTNLGSGLFQTKSILSPSKMGTQNQPDFKGIGGMGTTTSTQPSGMGGLFGNQQQSSLFGSTTSTTAVPSMSLGGTQQSTGLFQQTKPQTTSLFSTTPSMMSNQPLSQPSLFEPSKGLGSTTQQTGGFQGGLFAPTQQQTPAPTQQQYSTITQLQVTPESADFRNYLTNSMYKQKSITELLNDLQRHYQEQDFFLNDDYDSRKPKLTREINLGESK